MDIRLKETDLGYTLRIEFDTKEEAEEEIARFLKSHKLSIASCSHPCEEGNPVTYLICGYAGFKSNGANGGINETGVKRLVSIKNKINELYGVEL